MSGYLRMPLTTDAVARGCIAGTEGCNVIHKCDDCKKEMASLVMIDEMYIEYFKQLEYLKKMADEKVKEILTIKK